MNIRQAQITVKASQLQDILLEQYVYSAGSVEPLPKHSHQEYQIGLSFDCQGEYYYRGAYHPVPMGKLSIIHSGEIHAPSERTYLPKPATFLMMHIDPSLLKETALEIADKTSVPFFTEPILRDCNLAKLFQNLCLATQTNVTKLTRDSLLLDFLSGLITCDRELVPKSYQIRPAISQVCDYLQANYADNVSLTELADLAGISRFHLSRLFRHEKGISLGVYQRQIRIDRAKKLLAQGTPISQVAIATGFYDQSHFGHHFRRLVGTTPGNYRESRK